VARIPPPEAAPRATTDNRHGVDFGAGRDKGVLAVGKGISDAFESGANEMVPFGPVGQAEKHALGVGIIVRSPFAGKVRQENLIAWAVRVLFDRRQGRRLTFEPGHSGDPFETAGGAQDDAHLVPGAGQAVAEGMDALLRIGREAVVGQEIDTRRAERQERAAGDHGADAGGSRRIVSGAAGDRDSGRNAPGLGHVRLEVTGRSAAFNQ